MKTIKEIRERLQLTQVQFGQQFGLSVSSLRNWEQNNRKPEPTTVLWFQVIDRNPDLAREIARDVRQVLKTEDPLTLEQVLEKLSESKTVKREQTTNDVLDTAIWVAAWGLPGCAYESHDFCLTKKLAIESALRMANHPRGMLKDLRTNGKSYRVSPTAYVKQAVTVVYKTTVRDLL